MASTRTFLIDASTRHAVFVQRFAGGQIKEILPLLEKMRRTTVSQLKKQSVTKASRRTQRRILREIDAAIKELYDQLSLKVKGNMKEFAASEAEFSARMFQKGTDISFKEPTSTQIASAVFTSPLLLLDDELDIEQALRQLSKAKRRQIVNTIKDGIIAGKASASIVDDINFVTTKIQTNHASTLVRTITNHVSNAARQATIDANDDVIKGVEWVSTLDGGTTPTCQALDGREFERDKGPRPPIHWACRSTVIPVVKKEFSVLDKASRERPARGAQGVEGVKGTTTYNSWLKKQPASFQDEVLGKGKGKLFRQGGLPVSKFVDKNFKPLTLKQLKRKEPLAFERAGLSKKKK